MKLVKAILEERGISEITAGRLSFFITFVLLILICFISQLILKKVVKPIIEKIIKSNKISWDDYIITHKVLDKIMHIVPGIIFYTSSYYFFSVDNLTILKQIASIYIIITSVIVFNSILDVINEIYRQTPISNVRPIKGILQVVKIVISVIFGIIIIAIIMNEPPIILLSSIGAITAVFSFVFKDSILGFIAGIQLTSNDMLRIGDWVEMSKYGADGLVIDVTLITVKVQNFDKSIVTIPAYALVSDSFRNWRGMMEFGGRRIKRSINIDVNSIKFCTEEMVERFKKIHYLEDYIKEKETELAEYNATHKVNTELLINGRHMTNIGTFRAYISNYLKHHSGLNQESVQMVRQLPPGETGLPIEIYGFTNTIVWTEFEMIQGDIFDHILAVVEDFDLRIYQSPSGNDFRTIDRNK